MESNDLHNRINLATTREQKSVTDRRTLGSPIPYPKDISRTVIRDSRPD